MKSTVVMHSKVSKGSFAHCSWKASNVVNSVNSSGGKSVQILYLKFPSTHGVRHTLKICLQQVYCTKKFNFHIKMLKMASVPSPSFKIYEYPNIYKCCT